MRRNLLPLLGLWLTVGGCASPAAPERGAPERGPPERGPPEQGAPAAGATIAERRQRSEQKPRESATTTEISAAPEAPREDPPSALIEPAGAAPGAERPAVPNAPPVASGPGEKPEPAESLVDSAPPSSPVRRRSRQVDSYLRDLQGNPERAEEVYRKLWELPRHMVPYLVKEVDNRSPSSLRQLTLLVLNTDTFVRFDPDTQEVVGYNIPGMGDVEFDEIASGEVPRGYRVTLRRQRGFPVGVVARAALINRFRSTDYPAGDARERPVEWWDAFYRRVKDKL